MCEVTTAIMTTVAVGGMVMNHINQNNAANKNKRLANESAANDLGTLSFRERQERMASMSNILDIERSLQQDKASAAVSAGESGVAGMSVTALLSLIETRGDEAVSNVNTNLDNTKEQTAREARAVLVNRKSRIAAVPKASPIETGLSIAGAGLDAYTKIRGNRPIKGGG